MVKKFKMKNIPMQLYSSRYAPAIPGMESLFDVPNYANNDAMIKGVSEMMGDSDRMNVIFIIEQLSLGKYLLLSKKILLREKIAKATINMALLEGGLYDFDISEKDTESERKKKLEKNRELEKVKALIPGRLVPELRNFLLYNLHQHSLVKCSERVILTEILVMHYNSGVRHNESCCNPWKVLIKIPKDGKSFSVTSIYREDYRQNIDDGILCRVGPTTVSSTLSFCIGSDREIKANFDKISIRSSDESLVNYFSDRVRQAVAHQGKVIYKPLERYTQQEAISLSNDNHSTNEEHYTQTIVPPTSSIGKAVEPYEKTDNISYMEFLCHAKLQQIAAELSNNKGDSIHALKILIARIQKGEFAKLSIQQLKSFYKILELLEKYSHDALSKNCSYEEACEKACNLNELIIDRLSPEIGPVVLKMKISQKEVKTAINKEHIPPEIVKRSLDLVNLESLNGMIQLTMPKTVEFKPVYPKPNWNKIFQKNADTTISPQKKWAYKAFTTVGITLAVCFSVALVAGVIVGTGGVGAVPVIGTAIALALSPPIALSVLGTLVTSSIASTGFALWHKKDVVACEKSTKEYINKIENKVDEIREPIAEENAKLEVKSVQEEKKRDIGAITALPGFELKSAQKIIATSKSATLFGGANPKSNSSSTTHNSGQYALNDYSV